MIKIIGDNLEHVYEQASEKLQCSIENIHIDIVQYPRNIFGIIKKKAIVIAHKKEQSSQEVERNNDTSIDVPSEDKRAIETQSKMPVKNEAIQNSTDAKSTNDILSSFNAKDKNTQDEEILSDVAHAIKDIFCVECLDIVLDEVNFFDDKTIYIQFSGKDSSLMIGKNGFRYKALSYLIFSWIFSKYNLYVKIEIGEFLSNQNAMIKKHLKKYITQVDDFGYATTDNLDGVLLHLAIEHLRKKFPDKMVIIKTNADSTRYIKVCDFQ